jgi:TonB family protein
LVPATETADEQDIINEEVRRRLAAEKARLDQQRAQQLAAQQQAAEREQRASAQPRTEPRELVTSTQTEPPQTTPGQSAPSQPAPAADTTSANETSQTVPVSGPQESPPPQVAKQGDLVPPGTPGLVEPVLISMKKVPYPPIARMQKVGGNVIVNVLVSETGRVIEARILRGITQNVGINEAALEMARGATFQPATKDGARVKANKTLVVPFKL